MRILTFLFLGVGLAFAKVDKKQLNGIKRLIRNLPGNVYPICNMILFGDIVDYDTADAHCKDFDIGTGVRYNGNLVTVNDFEKNGDIKLLLEMAYPVAETFGKWANTSWVWAGMRKVHNTAPATLAERTYDLYDWEWADGSNPIGFVKWMNNQPDQKALKYNKKGCNESPKCYQNQMRINHEGKWDDTFKFKVHPYACDYRGKYIISPEQKTWWSAKEACEEAGLILAKMRSRSELDEIVNMAYYMLGATDPELRIFHPENWFWIGGNDMINEETWTWVDGEEIEDWGIPWRNPNPDNASFALKEGQNAMSLSKWGQVDDSYELKRKRAFVCQCPDT